MSKQEFSPFVKKLPFWKKIVHDIKINRSIYFLLLPVIAYYFLFHYMPMYGVQIAFKEYTMSKGILGSPWVGFDHFQRFFKSIYFTRLIRNTFVISLMDLSLGFPIPIIFALLLNEIRSNIFKRTIQTFSYMPHFISIVVIAGLIIDFTSRNGLINDLRAMLGSQPIVYLNDPGKFRWVYVLSGIWQEFGWGSIIYLSALTGIDPQLYEAATIDGAGRFRKLIHITLTGILPTVMIMLILRMGRMMSVGSEKILLLYNGRTYETADVISTYVYRCGLQDANYSFSAAVGLFNSMINFTLIILFNRLSKEITDVALW